MSDSIINNLLTWPNRADVRALFRRLTEDRDSDTDLDVENIIRATDVIAAALSGFGDTAGGSYFIQKCSSYIGFRDARTNGKGWPHGKWADKTTKWMSTNVNGVVTFPFAVVSRTLSNKRMRETVAALIEHSAWFQVMPLPNDLYRVTVKLENEHQLLSENSKTNE